MITSITSPIHHPYLTAEMTLEKLGILINSTAYTRSAIQLACAAKERGKTVEIFLASQGVRILENMIFRNLAGMGRVWVCSASFQALESTATLPIPETCQLVSPEQLADFIRSCDRHVVF